MKRLIERISNQPADGKILINVANEAAVARVDPLLFKAFVDKLNASVVYSVNGGTVASHTQHKNLGHILMGGEISSYCCFTNLSHSYGQIKASYQHQVLGDYLQINGNIDHSLQEFLKATERASLPTPKGFNEKFTTLKLPKARKEYCL